MRVLIAFLTVLMSCTASYSQVLISILFGEKLNSPNIEFGLDGGLNLASIEGLEPSDDHGTLNLGFYFDFKIKKNPSWMLHTGVIVKSTMGAKDIPVYSTGNADLDNAMVDGSVERRLGYFNVPILMKYKFANNLFVEAGPMVGLMNRSTNDIFTASIDERDDLNYKLNIKDRYHPLDAGMMAGIGYRLLGGNGMNLGVRYYFGFVDITIDDATISQYNRALYLAVGIPIGVGKKVD
jgi:hypothetical protein